MREIFDAPESVEPIIPTFEKEIAVHEAGHALVAEMLEPGSVNLVSINRHSGNIGGITSYYQNDNYWYALKYMENRVLSLLGGKAALEVKFGLVDVGANSDMHRAFDLVERFVDNYCSFGFDKFERRNSSQTLLEKKETYIHAELDRYYRQTKQIIVENMTFLDKLVSSLIEKKTITSSEIQMLKTC